MALVLINPVSGPSNAPAFFTEHVIPLLNAHGIPIHAVETTTAEGHAGTVLAQFLAEHPGPEAVTVVLGSGDGTLHELINATARSARAVNVALVPCGTANALYASLFPPTDGAETDPAYKLQSVQALIDKKSPKHLSLASTTLSSPDANAPTQTSVASVVVSTSLHASILHDSEALRAEHPGIERFKLAAQQNSAKWYRARLTLTGPVQLYDPKSAAFVPHPGAPDVTLAGPFAYFLSTVNVDRLEPAFRIAPLARAMPPPPGTCDIVILRPLRAPNVPADTPHARAAFVPTTWQALTGAYQDGAHVALTYGPDGVVSSEGNEPVIEYIRCSGWEWVPETDDADAHLVCADGAISRIPPQGKAVCTIDAFTHAFAVHV